MVLQKLAFALSVILHPLLMPTFLLGTLLYLAPAVVGVLNPGAVPGILGILFIITAFVPSLNIGILYLTRNIQSLQMESKKDRFLPLLSTSSLYAIGTYLFATEFASIPLLGLLLGAITLSIIIVMLITFFWKISAHSVGIGGVLGAFIGIGQKFTINELLIPVIITTIFAGCLMSARLYLNAHTAAQVWSGLLLGVLIALGAVWIGA